MQDHHRRLIEQEAENWRTEPRQPTTERDVYIYDIADGMMVVLAEKANHNRRSVDVHFDGTDLPLTARMIRARFLDPFGGPAS